MLCPSRSTGVKVNMRPWAADASSSFPCSCSGSRACCRLSPARTIPSCRPTTPPIPLPWSTRAGSGPTGPWTYGGDIIAKQTGSGASFTNHPGVVDYKGKSYFFYHNATLPGGGELAPIPWTPGLCRQRTIAQVGLDLVRGSVGLSEMKQVFSRRRTLPALATSGHRALATSGAGALRALGRGR
jgi:hypothetical protein